MSHAVGFALVLVVIIMLIFAFGCAFARKEKKNNKDLATEKLLGSKSHRCHDIDSSKPQRSLKRNKKYLTHGMHFNDRFDDTNHVQTCGIKKLIERNTTEKYDHKSLYCKPSKEILRYQKQDKYCEDIDDRNKYSNIDGKYMDLRYDSQRLDRRQGDITTGERRKLNSTPTNFQHMMNYEKEIEINADRTPLRRKLSVKQMVEEAQRISRMSQQYGKSIKLNCNTVKANSQNKWSDQGLGQPNAFSTPNTDQASSFNRQTYKTESNPISSTSRDDTKNRYNQLPTYDHNDFYAIEHGSHVHKQSKEINLQLKGSTCSDNSFAGRNKYSNSPKHGYSCNMYNHGSLSLFPYYRGTEYHSSPYDLREYAESISFDSLSEGDTSISYTQSPKMYSVSGNNERISSKLENRQLHDYKKQCLQNSPNQRSTDSSTDKKLSPELYRDSNIFDDISTGDLLLGMEKIAEDRSFQHQSRKSKLKNFQRLLSTIHRLFPSFKLTLSSPIRTSEKKLPPQTSEQSTSPLCELSRQMSNQSQTPVAAISLQKYPKSPPQEHEKPPPMDEQSSSPLTELLSFMSQPSLTQLSEMSTKMSQLSATQESEMSPQISITHVSEMSTQLPQTPASDMSPGMSPVSQTQMPVKSHPMSQLPSSLVSGMSHCITSLSETPLSENLSPMSPFSQSVISGTSQHIPFLSQIPVSRTSHPESHLSASPVTGIQPEITSLSQTLSSESEPRMSQLSQTIASETSPQMTQLSPTPKTETASHLSPTPIESTPASIFENEHKASQIKNTTYESELSIKTPIELGKSNKPEMLVVPSNVKKSTETEKTKAVQYRNNTNDILQQMQINNKRSKPNFNFDIEQETSNNIKYHQQNVKVNNFDKQQKHHTLVSVSHTQTEKKTQSQNIINDLTKQKAASSVKQIEDSEDHQLTVKNENVREEKPLKDASKNLRKDHESPGLSAGTLTRTPLPIALNSPRLDVSNDDKLIMDVKSNNEMDLIVTDRKDIEHINSLDNILSETDFNPGKTSTPHQSDTNFPENSAAETLNSTTPSKQQDIGWTSSPKGSQLQNGSKLHSILKNSQGAKAVSSNNLSKYYNDVSFWDDKDESVHKFSSVDGTVNDSSAEEHPGTLGHNNSSNRFFSSLPEKIANGKSIRNDPDVSALLANFKSKRKSSS